MIAAELMLVAGSMALVSFIAFLDNPGADGLMLLLSIWAVAAVEGMAIISFYVYVKARNSGFGPSEIYGTRKR